MDLHIRHVPPRRGGQLLRYPADAGAAIGTPAIGTDVLTDDDELERAKPASA
jgi:hypothetical protein